MSRLVTEQEIEDKRTGNGGWTRDTMAEWGIPWPPPRGWKKKLIRESNRLTPCQGDSDGR